MTYVSYDAFLPEVLHLAHDLPEIVAINAVRNACIEFCEKTRYLQQELTTFSTVIGQSNYAIATPADTIFVEPMESWFGGNLLIPKTPEELTRIYRFVDWRTFPGTPTYLTRMIQPEVMLIPVPLTVDLVNMRIAIAPSRASSTIDNEIVEHFIEYIAYGARARLYEIPNQPFYSLENSKENWQKFRAGIDLVRLKVNKGLSRASVAVEFQRFV